MILYIIDDKKLRTRVDSKMLTCKEDTMCTVPI